MPVAPEPMSYVDAAERQRVLRDGKDPLRCGSCGYEIVSYRLLPSCPMCREVRWEPASRRRLVKERV
jgi:hypothetical protein